MTKKKNEVKIPTREEGGVIYNSLNNFFNLNALCKKKNLNTQHVMNTKEFVDMLIKTCNALHREDGKYRVYNDIVINTKGRSSITWVHPMMLNCVLQKKDGTFFGRPSRSKTAKKKKENDVDDFLVSSQQEDEESSVRDDADFLEKYLDFDPEQPVIPTARDRAWIKSRQKEDAKLNQLMAQHPVKGALPRNTADPQYTSSLLDLENQKRNILQQMKQSPMQGFQKVVQQHAPLPKRGIPNMNSFHF